MLTELHTERLLLRPFTLADAPEQQRLAGDRRIADTTLTIPHPYPDGVAEQFIASLEHRFAQQTGVTFAVVERTSGRLIGLAALNGIAKRHRRADLVYWIGAEHWGKGYCTEAACALLDYGHTELGLTRFVGYCLTRNPASARVLEKLGMQREGLLPKHVEKWGRYEDLLVYGLCLSERTGT